MFIILHIFLINVGYGSLTTARYKNSVYKLHECSHIKYIQTKNTGYNYKINHKVRTTTCIMDYQKEITIMC